MHEPATVIPFPGAAMPPRHSKIAIAVALVAVACRVVAAVLAGYGLLKLVGG